MPWRRNIKRKEVNLKLGLRYHQKLIYALLVRFMVLVCHRRFGKTIFARNVLINKGLTCTHEHPRVAYVAPTYKQAKRVVWDEFVKVLRDYPGVKFNANELTITLPRTGDFVTIFLLGAEEPDSLRGIYLDYVVLDEYAQCPPSVWSEVIRHTLSDRKGGAMFIGTPKGINHFKHIYDTARRLHAEGRSWRSFMFRASETGIIPKEELEDARAAMDEESYLQEYECSFEAQLSGAYYGKQMNKLEEGGQIKVFAHEPTIGVQTFWDLGMRDSTSIWFAQVVGQETWVIDYLEASGESLEYYVREVQAKPYLYMSGGHILPHDARVRELGSGKSRIQTLWDLGFDAWVPPKKASFEDGIQAARTLLSSPRIFFHRDNCAKGLDSLRNYAKDYDEKLQVYRKGPRHDWASHGADAFRYLALELRDKGGLTRVAERKDNRRNVQMEWDELEF